MSNMEIFFSQSDAIQDDLTGLFEICEQIVLTAKVIFRSRIFSDANSNVTHGQITAINIRVCDAHEMCELNHKWRGKDKVTDVLSFENQESSHEPAFEPIKILGDLVICLEQANKQAQELGHDLREEIAVLAAHGFCHLMGLDHEMGPGEAQKQLKQEMAILEKAGFNKELSLLARNEL